MTEGTWTVERRRGSASSFHQREVAEPAERALWCFEVEGAAVVLGSTQRAEVIDRGAAERRGIEVATRRSGGGAVYLAPAQTTWIDVVLPSNDDRWTDDVGRSFGWLGRAWAAVLVDLGHADVTVHEGALVRSDWSDLVCFAGLGPGEVSIGGRKVVGISQRRTRSAARFQCVLLHRWDPRPLLEVLDLTAADRRRAGDELHDVAIGVRDIPAGDASTGEVVERLLAAIGAPPG